MPSTPYIRVLTSVNADPAALGSRTVANGDTIALTYESTVAWPSDSTARLEFFSYPDGWAGPGAPWVTESVSVERNGSTITYDAYVYTGNTPPPSFTAPAGPAWGKYLLSAKLGNGQKNGRASSDMYDESSGFEILSAEGLHDLAWRETSSFATTRPWTNWTEDHRANLETIDAGLAAAAPVVTLTAGAGLTGGGTTAANRTFDVGAGSGITVNANDVAVTFGVVGEMAAAANVNSAGVATKSAPIDHTHAISAASGVAAGTMSAAHYTAVNSRTSSATATTIIERDAAGRAQVADPSANADIDTKGARDAAIAAAVVSTRFTSAGSYTIPTTCKMIRIAIQAPGGGGGGGATRGAGVAAGGGGAGGGGGYSEHIFHAATLLALGASIAYDPGTPGAAGVGAVGVNGDGTAGGTATDATATVSGTQILAASGGTGGGGGTTAGGAAGTGGAGQETGGNGTAGTAGTAPPSPVNSANRAAAGGGGGGGMSAADVYSDGGDGGSSVPVWRGTVNGGTGGPDGANGVAGGAVPDYPLGGAGGGGGGGYDIGNGGDGGEGGISGGGGGGGGGSRNGFAAGDGGSGRAGSIVIQAW